ncbi:MAG: radical SAM protein [Patescibacteria group bacterium]|nr:radical SAM protein [Patescibacteria group bacterium]
MKKEKMYFIRLPLVCNFNCLFCFIDKKANHYSDSLVGNISKQIDDAVREKYNKITFSGGEPTLIKELCVLIDYARKKGIKKIEIQTNALRCSYKNYVNELKNAGLTSVLIGFHSHKEEKFNYLTRTKDYFPKVLEGIQNLFERKIDVSFNHTITSLTYQNLREYVEFLFKNFPKPKSVFLTFVYPCGQCWEHKKLIPKVSQVAPYYLEAWKRCQQEEVKVLMPHCGIPGFPLCLLEGKPAELKDLISSDRKNIRTEEFECINIKAKSCQKCVYNEVCVGIAVNYKKLYGLKEFEL